MPTMTVTGGVGAAVPARRGSIAMRALGWFWIAVAVAAAAGAGTLQYLGPSAHPAAKSALVPEPSRPSPAARAPQPAPPAPATAAPATAAPTVTANAQPAPPAPAAAIANAAPVGAPPALDQPAPIVPIHAPDPALLEVAPDYAPAMLPKIAPDGRKPMQVYAASFNPTDRRPRIAIMLGGIGQSESDSQDAIATLAPGISLVVSPYASRTDKLLVDMRARGHEFLIGLPMEPANNPMNSEGSFQLMTGAVPEQNARNLEWALSRIQGYVGATNALDGLRGERFAASSQQMATVLQDISNRGLFYVDALPPGSRQPLTGVTNMVTRGIDLVIDEPAVRSEIDLRLTQLEQIARERGVAVGLAGLPRPVTRSRLAAWSDGLAARGLALAPISAIMRIPAANPSAATTSP